MKATLQISVLVTVCVLLVLPSVVAVDALGLTQDAEVSMGVGASSDESYARLYQDPNDPNRYCVALVPEYHPLLYGCMGIGPVLAPMFEGFFPFDVRLYSPSELGFLVGHFEGGAGIMVGVASAQVETIRGAPLVWGFEDPERENVFCVGVLAGFFDYFAWCQEVDRNVARQIRFFFPVTLGEHMVHDAVADGEALAAEVVGLLDGPLVRLYQDPSDSNRYCVALVPEYHPLLYGCSGFGPVIAPLLEDFFPIEVGVPS